MGLQGSLDTMPIVELFDWMNQKQRTGMLEVKRDNITKMFTIEQGRVINAASTDAREYFGQFLINFGLITEDQLQKAFETQQETKILIGKILVMTGLVSEEDVHRILELKIRETALDVFLWDQGTFNFQDGVLPDEPSVVPVSVTLTNLYQEGIHRRKLHLEIRKTIPANSCCFTCRAQAAPGELDPKSAPAIILELARQGYSAQDIILRFHSLDFPILKSLYDMVQKGWLAVASGAGSQQPEAELPELDIDIETIPEPHMGPDAFLMTAQESMQKRDFDTALAALKRGLAEHPYDPDLCEALELAEKGLAEKLRADMLSDKQVPYLLRDDLLRISANWTPAQRYILSRIDGQRNLRSIIMVSPLKEVEALKTFRSLIQAGFVGLR